MGYHRAGFDVVGVDNRPQPRYPFTFVQADAMTYPLDGYDAIHASPPCQAYSVATRESHRQSHPDLLGPARKRLETVGAPWVIENVPGAPMRVDFQLCGCLFGLPRLRRERWFETSWRGFDLRPPCQHLERPLAVVNGGIQTWELRDGWPRLPAAELHSLRSQAMGIDWIPSRRELAQAIPPAYTEYIGGQLLEHLKERAA
jgi:DNA (cytosine-5)-methyltransferase 1